MILATFWLVYMVGMCAGLILIGVVRDLRTMRYFGDRDDVTMFGSVVATLWPAMIVVGIGFAVGVACLRLGDAVARRFRRPQ